MADILNSAEIEQLKAFRFTTEETSSALSIRLDRLLDEEIFLRYLENAGSRIGSPGLKVTASIFFKRYAFLTVIYLYGMTVWNKKLPVSFNNISIQTNDTEDLWLPKFLFHSLKFEMASENRKKWREKALKEFFAESAFGLIEHVSAAKVPKSVLWENIAIYVFWLYETVLPELEDECIRKRAKEDFAYLISEVPGNIFGYEQENPIHLFYHNGRNEQNVRVRTTCCFSYALEGSNKRCKTCPRK
ncbi:IucA/IucC family C-terminal-domain containing protein [Bacillus benzoevorans]|uniref:Ferric iron reductase protein FhuF n=1 Tax=Bacillus benzoevorans TaxID=1456 RepID=A0A7X0LW31_9BACI|nr:IucA/IucC family C-terminal-domain containing protein [Bacillus benzoevorans]MBB6446170.1 ferric iron reductase protein FhuF [Bacillus benzoevorans]